MSTRTRTATSVAVVVLAFLFAACSNEPDTTGETIQTTSDAPATNSTDGAAERTTATPPPERSSTSQPTSDGLVLRNDGLGAVAFGEPIEPAMEVLIEVIGSPPDTAEGGDFFEFSGWQDLGLFVGFSTSGWSEFDGTSRFIGWSYSGSSDGTDLRTQQGVRIGTPVAELLASYGDRLTLPEVEGACGWAYEVAAQGPTGTEPNGVLDRPPTEDALVGVLFAGLGVGC